MIYLHDFSQFSAALGVVGDHANGRPLRIRHGALRVDGQTVDYYRISGLTFGLEAGGQERSMIIVFMTEDALAGFRASEGWEFGVDGSFVVLDFVEGEGYALDSTSIRDPIVTFIFDIEGFMGGGSFKGTKFDKIIPD